MIKKYFVFVTILVLTIQIIKSQDFEVAPIRLDYNAEPGEAQVKKITITNHNSNKTSFILSLGDYYRDNKGVRKHMPPNSIKRSCADWISISPSFLEINPNEAKEVSITLQVPSNEYNTRWALIFVQSVKEQTAFGADKAVNAGMLISPMIAVTVTQSPSSTKNYKAQINNFIEVKSSSDTLRCFTANVDNIGDKILRCKVYLVASNIQTGEETQFSPIDFELLPESSRTVELKLPLYLPDGSYSLAAILDYGAKGNLSGAQIIVDLKQKLQPPSKNIDKPKVNDIFETPENK